MIQVLDKLTIDQIAAGEVVERPLSIVKELVENAIDAGADAITVELRGGGIDQIRVTDNGCGIEKSEIPTAFLRHATSKIIDASDLLNISSLGFRGEALSSIAAISKVELITRTHDSIVGSRYTINGGEDGTLEEVGAPEGTTIIVRDVFYNTPARKEFLKSATSEGNAIKDCMLELSLSHPGIRFQFISDGKPRFKTSGDDSLKTCIYTHFGSDLTKVLLPIDKTENGIRVHGCIAKPAFSRGNRGYMFYYVNSRFIKNNTVQAAIMDGYRDYMMNHRYPFTLLMIEISPDRLDVNIHPTKREVRFRDDSAIYELIYHAVKEALDNITLIPELSPGQDERVNETPVQKYEYKSPEPFEVNRTTEIKEDGLENLYKSDVKPVQQKMDVIHPYEEKGIPDENASTLSSVNVFSEEKLPAFRIIGQVFDTYWLIEYKDELLIIDQHAAHEKVLYERVVKKMKDKEGISQSLLAPIVVSLSGTEKQTLTEYSEPFISLGYVWEDFGDAEIRITSVPADFLNLDPQEVFLDVLDSLIDERKGKKPEVILDHLATMSCKAAIKGNNTLSYAEAKTLIGEMLTLEEPYHCPHGRPTTIAMSKTEFEKKFKRIV